MRNLSEGPGKLRALGRLAASFLKIGVIGFGGGSALIPVMERELAQGQTELSREDFLRHTVVANITPGALPVKLGATCGLQLSGVGGAAAGALLVSLPGTLICLLLLNLFTLAGETAIRFISYASVGISVYIVFLLAQYTWKVLQSGKRSIAAAICAGAFLATCGSELRQLGALVGLPVGESVPLLDISTIELMIVTFFVLMILDRIRTRGQAALVALEAGAFVLLSGKTAQALHLETARWMAIGAMAVTLLVFLLRSTGHQKRRVKLAPAVMAAALAFVLLPLAFMAAVAVVCRDSSVFTFGKDVMLSTMVSFGGGEAYVSVADGFFVQTGIVSAEEFYTQLVAVANALPGPILVKIAAGTGFLFGKSCLAGSWLMAAVSALLSIGVCGAVAILVSGVYEAYQDSSLIKNLSMYILPVIGGMLLSTSCAMFAESAKTVAAAGGSAGAALLVMTLSAAAMWMVQKKTRIKDSVLLVLGAGVSFAVLFVRFSLLG